MKRSLLFLILVGWLGMEQALANDVCNCKGYKGVGGSCYAGVGGAAYAGVGGPA